MPPLDPATLTVADLRRPGDPPDDALVTVETLLPLLGYSDSTTRNLLLRLEVPIAGAAPGRARTTVRTFRWGDILARMAEHGVGRDDEQRGRLHRWRLSQRGREQAERRRARGTVWTTPEPRPFRRLTEAEWRELLGPNYRPLETPR